MKNRHVKGGFYRFALGFLGCTFLFLSQPTNGLCQIYQWEDDQGGLHFSDDLSQVPENKRSQSKREKKKFSEENDAISTLKTPKPDAANPAPAAATDEKGNGTTQPKEKASGDAPKPATADKDNPKKEEYWQDKVAKAQKELDDAQRELDQISDARRKNLESGPGMQARQAEYAEREATLKAKVETLQKSLDEDIPEQARRAGIPPGALR